MSKNSGKEKKALSVLTEEFLNVLTSAEGKEVDLSKLENSLGVSKRRLYDVTNVLAGIGLVERSGKAKVRWVGQSRNEESEIKKCVERERELDDMLAFIDLELNTLESSQEFVDYGWVTSNDIFTLAPDSNVKIFSLCGPEDLTITSVEHSPGSNHLVCTSNTGGIEFSLVPFE